MGTLKTKVRWCRWRKVLLTAVIMLLLLIFVIPPTILAAVVFQHVDYHGSTPLQQIHSSEMYSLQGTEHTFETEDGEAVWCAEVKTEHPQGVILYLSGITKPSVTQFYSHAAWLAEYDFASFLLEVRAHGNSTGKQVGLGFLEVADVQAAVEYIKGCPEYKDLPIIIWGVSMGGAIAINSFGQLDEIDACIAMSPYASVEREVDLQMERYWVPAPIRKIELWMLDFFLEQFYGSEKTAELLPEVQIQNSNGRPIFLIASEGDLVVPVENTQILQEKARDAKVWIRDTSDHFVVRNNNFSAVVEDTEYCSRILEWLSEAVLTQS